MARLTRSRQRQEWIRDCLELTRTRRVLVAEDDWEMRRLVAGRLRREGFEVVEVENGRDLLRMLGSRLSRRLDRVDLVVTDVRMPGLSGLEVLAELRREDPTTPVIVITAFGDAALHAQARRLGAAAVFDKPFDLGELATATRRHTAP